MSTTNEAVGERDENWLDAQDRRNAGFWTREEIDERIDAHDAGTADWSRTGDVVFDALIERRREARGLPDRHIAAVEDALKRHVDLTTSAAGDGR